MQAIYIFAAMLLGVLFPQGHQFTFLVRYFLMIMLFYAFLRIRFDWRILSGQHLLVAGLNILLPLFFFFLLRPVDMTLALASFAIGITPTAAGAPVMATFLKTEVQFVTASVILTSPLIALVLPFVLPLVASVDESIDALTVLQPVAMLVFVPLIISQLIRRYLPKIIPWLHRLGNIPFYLFVTNVFIAAGKATQFIRHESEAPWSVLLGIAATVGMVGLIQFKVGERLVGRRSFPIESGLALGRKNTMFGLWVALTFLNPLVALGPIFYIVYQNLYNAWQLYRLGRAERAEKMAQA